MRDEKSIALLNRLHPSIRQDAIDAYNEAVRITPKGVHPVIIETTRSFERSNSLYNQPFDKKDNDGDGRIDEADEKVSNSKGGSSYHNYGLAIDFALVINGKLSWVVDKNWRLVAGCFKKRGFTWGGDWKSFKDYPHVEKTFGFHWKQLLVLHNKKQFIPGETYINLVA